MTNYSDWGGPGSVILKKTLGSGPFTLNSQVTIPSAIVQPFKPLNTTYLQAINAAQGTSLSVAGNQTPAIALRTYYKPTWGTAALLKSLIQFRDTTTFYTDQFAMQVKSQYRTRKFSKGRCTGLTITHTKQGNQPGPIIVDMGFVFIYGDLGGAPDDPSPPTFSAAATDAGQATNAGQVAWATATQVKSFQLQMNCVQEYQFSDNNTLFADDIATGPPDGGLALVQSDSYTAAPTTTDTLSLGGVGAGIAIALNLDLHTPFTPQDGGFIKYNSAFKLANLTTGGIPWDITAL